MAASSRRMQRKWSLSDVQEFKPCAASTRGSIETEVSNRPRLVPLYSASGRRVGGRGGSAQAQVQPRGGGVGTSDEDYYTSGSTCSSESTAYRGRSPGGKPQASLRQQGSQKHSLLGLDGRPVFDRKRQPALVRNGDSFYDENGRPALVPVLDIRGEQVYNANGEHVINRSGLPDGGEELFHKDGRPAAVPVVDGSGMACMNRNGTPLVNSTGRPSSTDALYDTQGREILTMPVLDRWGTRCLDRRGQVVMTRNGLPDGQILFEDSDTLASLIVRDGYHKPCYGSDRRPLFNCTGRPDFRPLFDNASGQPKSPTPVLDVKMERVMPGNAPYLPKRVFSSQNGTPTGQSVLSPSVQGLRPYGPAELRILGDNGVPVFDQRGQYLTNNTGYPDGRPMYDENGSSVRPLVRDFEGQPVLETSGSPARYGSDGNCSRGLVSNSRGSPLAKFFAVDAASGCGKHHAFAFGTPFGRPVDAADLERKSFSVTSSFQGRSERSGPVTAMKNNPRGGNPVANRHHDDDDNRSHRRDPRDEIRRNRSDITRSDIFPSSSIPNDYPTIRVFDLEGRPVKLRLTSPRGDIVFGPRGFPVTEDGVEITEPLHYADGAQIPDKWGNLQVNTRRPREAETLRSEDDRRFTHRDENHSTRISGSLRTVPTANPRASALPRDNSQQRSQTSSFPPQRASFHGRPVGSTSSPNGDASSPYGEDRKGCALNEKGKVRPEKYNKDTSGGKWGLVDAQGEPVADVRGYPTDREGLPLFGADREGTPLHLNNKRVLLGDEIYEDQMIISRFDSKPLTDKHLYPTTSTGTPLFGQDRDGRPLNHQSKCVTFSDDTKTVDGSPISNKDGRPLANKNGHPIDVNGKPIYGADREGWPLDLTSRRLPRPADNRFTSERIPIGRDGFPLTDEHKFPTNADGKPLFGSDREGTPLRSDGKRIKHPEDSIWAADRMFLLSNRDTEPVCDAKYNPTKADGSPLFKSTNRSASFSSRSSCPPRQSTITMLPTGKYASPLVLGTTPDGRIELDRDVLGDCLRDGEMMPERMKNDLMSMANDDIGYYETEDDGSLTWVRFIPKEMVEERVTYNKVKETVVTERKVPKFETVEVLKTVEVPHVEYVEIINEIENIVEVIKEVPIKKVVECPREVITYKDKEVVVDVEQVVEVPGDVIENEVRFDIVNTERVLKPQDESLPVVVSQILTPEIHLNPDYVQTIDAYTVDPVMYPVDVFVPFPVQSTLRLVEVSETAHYEIKVPGAHFNSLVNQINQELSHDLRLPLFHIPNGLEGTIPMLPSTEVMDVIPLPAGVQYRPRAVAGSKSQEVRMFSKSTEGAANYNGSKHHASSTRSSESKLPDTKKKLRKTHSREKKRTRTTVK